MSALRLLDERPPAADGRDGGAAPRRRRGAVAAALAAADAFLFERSEPERAGPRPVSERSDHAQVVVAGVGARCGATTIARALALELGRRSRTEAVVSGPAVPVRTAALQRAPVVVDWPYGLPVAEALALGMPLVLVATPDTDPALAASVAAAVPGARRVLNRARRPPPSGEDGAPGPPPPGLAADLRVPEARLAARLAAAGRPAPGRFGRAIAGLADLVG